MIGNGCWTHPETQRLRITAGDPEDATYGFLEDVDEAWLVHWCTGMCVPESGQPGAPMVSQCLRALLGSGGTSRVGGSLGRREK